MLKVIPRPCLVCARYFTPGSPAQRCCSPACAHTRRRERRASWRANLTPEHQANVRARANARRLATPLTCAACGNAYQPRKQTQRFCSRPCVAAVKRRRVSPSPEETEALQERCIADAERDAIRTKQHLDRRQPWQKQTTSGFAEELLAAGLPADPRLAACELRIPLSALYYRLTRAPHRLFAPLRKYSVHRPVDVPVRQPAATVSTQGPIQTGSMNA